MVPINAVSPGGWTGPGVGSDSGDVQGGVWPGVEGVGAMLVREEGRVIMWNRSFQGQNPPC